MKKTREIMSRNKPYVLVVLLLLIMAIFGKRIGGGGDDDLCISAQTSSIGYSINSEATQYELVDILNTIPGHYYRVIFRAADNTQNPDESNPGIDVFVESNLGDNKKIGRVEIPSDKIARNYELNFLSDNNYKNLIFRKADKSKINSVVFDKNVFVTSLKARDNVQLNSLSKTLFNDPEITGDNDNLYPYSFIEDIGQGEKLFVYKTKAESANEFLESTTDSQEKLLAFNTKYPIQRLRIKAEKLNDNSINTKIYYSLDQEKWTEIACSCKDNLPNNFEIAKNGVEGNYSSIYLKIMPDTENSNVANGEATTYGLKYLEIYSELKNE